MYILQSNFRDVNNNMAKYVTVCNAISMDILHFHEILSYHKKQLFIQRLTGSRVEGSRLTSIRIFSYILWQVSYTEKDIRALEADMSETK